MIGSTPIALLAGMWLATTATTLRNTATTLKLGGSGDRQNRRHRKAWVGQERPDRTAQILQKHKGLYTAGGEQFSFSRMSQIT